MCDHITGVVNPPSHTRPDIRIKFLEFIEAEKAVPLW
jgi:hypothetical protein